MYADATGKNKKYDLVDKGRFVIPNLITLLSMGLGLTSVFYAMRGMNSQNDWLGAYKAAGWLVLLCSILDKLDGTSARFLKAVSAFGTELDSFSDFVAFGLAPSALVYAVLSDPRLGATPGTEDLVFFYAGLLWFVFATALRLARYNVTTTPKSTFLDGLPTTAAGSLIAAYMLTGLEHYTSTKFFVAWNSLVPFLMMALGLLMVSTLKLPKVAKRKSKLFNLWQLLNFLLLTVLILLRKLPEVLLFLGTIYVIGGFGYCIIFKDKVNAIIEEEHKAAQQNSM